MKAALLHKPYDIRIEEIADPKVGPEDVLLEGIHTGICGSDINRYKGFKGSEAPVFPAILGHEISGTVSRTGEKVTDFQVGDRVYGIQPESLSRYVVVPQARLFKLPDTVGLEEAQSIGPVGGTLHAINLSGIRIGDTVVVLGPGHAGLILIQWAKMAGANQVVITGTRDNRLQAAKELGVDFTINIREEDPAKRIRDITDGLGVDVVIEATGRPEAVRHAIEMVKVDGTIVIYGVGQELVDGFDIYSIYRKHIKMIGTQGRTDHERETVVRYLASGKLAVKPIITHIFSLEETGKAFEIVDKRLENVIRAIIKS